MGSMDDAAPGWDTVEEDLAAVLHDLSEREFVVLGEPAPTPHARGPFRRTPPPRPNRYVQFQRDRDWLYAECVGATLFGGDWEVPVGVHEQLRTLGWLAPGDPDPAGTRPSYPNYWCTLPREDHRRAAAMGVGALRLLGAQAGALQRQRDH